jgi:predicted transcriptional regulator
MGDLQWVSYNPYIFSKMSGGLKMQMTNLKQEAHRLVEQLPEDATWDDLMYQLYVRQAIEAGLADSDAGRTVDVQEVRAKFGLSK